MKIGIVTMQGDNYGNRLQNYALQQTLTKISNGGGVTSLQFCKNRKTGTDKRRLAFEKFNKENVNLLQIKSNKQLKKVGEEFDCFFVGSDQIWNPYAFVPSKIKFLKFAEKQKCFAYSPSFGISYLPLISRVSYAKGLKHLQIISVREDAGARIVKKVLGKDVPVLPDPTLLLNGQEWADFSGEKPVVEGKYLCTYFLGKDKKHMQQVENYAKKFNLEIVKMNDKGYGKFFNLDPKAFVNVIKNAQLVCTDSFHGSIFSIIFGKPFVIFQRKDLNASGSSRMTTLFQKLQIEAKIGKIPENPFEMKFDFVQKNLEAERIRAFDFLQDCFGGLK